ncbi:MAG: hypothetical protein IAF08_11420, partial [Rhizobacter sp.]|nr:hypothetical protein [Chlorobiales bacterium]
MPVMRSVLPVVFYLFFCVYCWRTAAAQTSSPTTLAAPERYSRVRINLAPEGTLIKLTMLGVLDHALREKGSLITELSDTDLAVLKDAGIAFEVMQSDMAKVYETELAAASKKRAMRTQSTPVNFEFGAMSGYSTFDEAVAQLDAMLGTYPSLVSDKVRIGTSIEGRPMWAVRLGSPQSVGKPQVLYTSLHHAREPG